VSILSNSPAGLKAPILCYVTDRKRLAAPPRSQDELSRLVAKIAQLVRAGVDWIQIREKDLTGKQLSSLTRDALRESRAARPAAEYSATRILVNDRVDVALAENADGVHLGENSLPVAEVAQFVKRPSSPEDFLVGASCHSIEGARSAAADRADYIVFGPIFATPSKAQFGQPQGVERLAEVCRMVSIPVVAIGGITLDNADACVGAGAAGIAAVRLFQDSRDPAGLIRSLRARRR